MQNAPFGPASSDNLSWKPIFDLLCSGPLRQVLLYLGHLVLKQDTLSTLLRTGSSHKDVPAWQNCYIIHLYFFAVIIVDLGRCLERILLAQLYSVKSCFISTVKHLTHKVPPIFCSRRQIQILLLFQKKRIRHDISWESSAGRQFSWNIILYFFRKLEKMSQDLSPAAVVIGDLRVNIFEWPT